MEKTQQPNKYTPPFSDPLAYCDVKHFLKLKVIFIWFCAFLVKLLSGLLSCLQTEFGLCSV